jgi:hypothetical protein
MIALYVAFKGEAFSTLTSKGFAKIVEKVGAFLGQLPLGGV